MVWRNDVNERALINSAKYELRWAGVKETDPQYYNLLVVTYLKQKRESDTLSFVTGFLGGTSEIKAFQFIKGLTKGKETLSVLKQLLSTNKGNIVRYALTGKSSAKIDYIFNNLSDAKNFATGLLGKDAIRVYDDAGSWIGWSSGKGKVYWGHGDWGQGLGLSNFPHLNYEINGIKGHMFLKDKITNKGMFDDFIKTINE